MEDDQDTNTITDDDQDDYMMMHMDAGMGDAPVISLNICFMARNISGSFVAATKSDAVCCKSHSNRLGDRKQVLISPKVQYCSDNEVATSFISYQQILC